MTDKTREQFETWSKAEFPHEAPNNYSTINGKYVDHIVSTRWHAWQASRTAALDEAAKACEGEALEDPTNESGDIAYGHAVSDCAAAIRRLISFGSVGGGKE